MAKKLFKKGETVYFLFFHKWREGKIFKDQKEDVTSIYVEFTYGDSTLIRSREISEVSRVKPKDFRE